VGGGVLFAMNTSLIPEPVPSSEARAMLELSVGALALHESTELHLNNTVHSAVRAGATWDHVGYWLNMTAPEAATRFENADGAIYLDEHTIILLSQVADREGLTSLTEAIGVVLRHGVEVAESTNGDAAAASNEPTSSGNQQSDR
jgi:hypothetical protein